MKTTPALAEFSVGDSYVVERYEQHSIPICFYLTPGEHQAIVLRLRAAEEVKRHQEWTDKKLQLRQLNNRALLGLAFVAAVALASWSVLRW